ncbi:MAG: radical SAM protein [Gammaproteobacteria bacterium]|nr:radical SAM protein [Gammaproteobacteria bacterium]
MEPLLLPWTGSAVPHAILDINRACNITCRGCYNKRANTYKSMDDIEREIHQLLKLRRLHTITILGGEPMLHPQLEQIILLAKHYVDKVALVSNGLLFDTIFGKRLKKSGLDLILFHIDGGQLRPDLNSDATLVQINELRSKKALDAIDAGLNVGMQAIGYGRALDDISGVVEFVLRTPKVSHLLVTNYTCVDKFKQITGSVENGLEAEFNPDRPIHKDEVCNEQIEQLLQQKGCKPFAYVAAQHDLQQRRWLSYQLCTITSGELVNHHAMTSSLFERLALALTYKIRGGYLFFFKPSRPVIRVQLFMNAILGGNLTGNLMVLFKSIFRANQLESKHLVFQEGPDMKDGQLIICRDCPDATLKDGRLVPLCLTDKTI